jgi:hypothetical protein
MTETTLLDKVLAEIVAKPDNWDQSCWVAPVVPYTELPEIGTELNVCGTTMCLAGWALVCSGEWKPIVAEDPSFGSDSKIRDSKIITFVNVSTGLAPKEHLEAEAGSNSDLAWELGVRGGVAAVARRLLGLTDADAHHLFFGDLDTDDPEEFAAAVRHYLEHSEG